MRTTTKWQIGLLSLSALMSVFVVSLSLTPAQAQPPETKPAETKPAETKPVETKPPETQPAETKPAETKPAETKPAETKPAETKAATKLTGAELYAINCNRCHTERDPTEFTSAQWKTIMIHMRVRANLPAEQADLILKYFQEVRGN